MTADGNDDNVDAVDDDGGEGRCCFTALGFSDSWSDSDSEEQVYSPSQFDDDDDDGESILAVVVSSSIGESGRS